MLVSQKACEVAERRADKLPKELLKPRALEFVPRVEGEVEKGALAARISFMRRSGAQPTSVEFERLMGTNDLVDEFYLERALLSAQPVCRISLRENSGHEAGSATGFMVSPRLLMTNHHVLRSADEAAPSLAEFNYKFDIAGRPETSYLFRLRPDLFYFRDEELDFALVSVDPRPLQGNVRLDSFGYHRLIADTGKELPKEWLTIIQHPGGARRQFAIRENQLISADDPDVLWYMSDTAQGSSGAPVLNDSFQVIALHHQGVPQRDEATGEYILKDGSRVPNLDDVDDSRVAWIANEGIRISRICKRVLERGAERNGHVAELQEAMQGGDVLTRAYQGETQRGGGSVNGPERQQPRVENGRIVLGTLVLDLNRRALAGLFGGGVVEKPQETPAPATDGAAAGEGEEGYKMPIIDRDYSSRNGFNPQFLGIDTPHPTVIDESLIAPLLAGGNIVPYEHFSLVLHKERKLAIYTASNVDASPAAKKPETGKDYTRKGLNGFTGNQAERWSLDPRVDEAFQIPDTFYTNDDQAFDKGHIVRREDVCFGGSYAQVQRANGDSFHVTNCSPQRGKFNQSGLSGIWGQLENFIGAQADEEKFCIFAGPVLDPSDGVFSGTESVLIPARFWKVVCAVKDHNLQVFAFVLEQDLTDLPLEFQVTAEWKAKQKSLADLEAIIKLVRFPQAYHDADQF
jgi:endonuclease G